MIYNIRIRYENINLSAGSVYGDKYEIEKKDMITYIKVYSNNELIFTKATVHNIEVEEDKTDTTITILEG